MLYRLLAAFASLAHGLERSVRGIFAFLPVPISAVLLTVGLLTAGAALTTAATIEAIASQPGARETTVAEIADPEGRAVVGWVTIEGVLTAELVVGRDLDGDGEETPDEALRYYVMADAEQGGTALLVRARRQLPVGESGPVTLSGVLSSDPTLGEVTDEPEIASALEGTTYAPTRFLVEGTSPPMPFRPSFTPSLLMALAALVLLASWLTPYPIFVRREVPAPSGEAPERIASGDAIAVDLRGRLPTPVGQARIERTPARLTRMPVDEAARRRWQYWGAELAALGHGLEEETLDEAGGQADLLALHSGHASIFLALGTRSSAALRLERGDVYTLRGRRPALRIRGTGIDATLAFRSHADRERAFAEMELQERASGREAATPLPETRPGFIERLRPTAGAERPVTITLAAILLVALGIVTAIGAFTTADAAGIVQPPAAVALRLAVAAAAAAALVASAFGIYAGREWGRVLVVNLALVGLFLAFVSLVSSQVCLQPVGPTQSCQPEREAIDRLVSAGTLIVLAFGLWAVAAGAAYFGESQANQQPALH